MCGWPNRANAISCASSTASRDRLPADAAALLAAAVATVVIGSWGVRLSRTTSDFLVASRSVGPRWNAAAISGEYLSAASFLGVAGLIAKYGADALWYPVGFTAGYLGLLLFVAAPLRRSGAYTVPDFAEFRLGSPRLRKVAMLVVVVVCLFYLAPSIRRRAGAEDAARFPGVDRAVVVGGIVITNVVGGGMRSITFVQAFQYWLKLTAVAIPALALLGLFLSDRGQLGGPLPPSVEHQTTVQIETDVVVQVVDPSGIAVTGKLDGNDGARQRFRIARAAHPGRGYQPDPGRRCGHPGGGRHPEHRQHLDHLGHRTRRQSSLYQVLSIIIATFLGTMGYRMCWCGSTPTRTARPPAHRTGGDRAAVAVYVFPILLGVFSRLYVPQLLITGTADAAVLLAPGSAIGGAFGQLLAALVAPVPSRRSWRPRRACWSASPARWPPMYCAGRVRDFRVAAVIAGDPDPALAAGGRSGVVPHGRACLRRRRLHALSAAGARHLVARADRGRCGRRPCGRWHGLRWCGAGGHHRRRRRARAGRLARGDGGLSGRGQRATGIPDHGRGQQIHPGPCPTSRRSSRGCTCRNASGWVSSGSPRADRLAPLVVAH
jgi:hypothetical protein